MMNTLYTVFESRRQPMALAFSLKNINYHARLEESWARRRFLAHHLQISF